MDRRQQLAAMGQPEAWTQHQIDRLDRPIRTYTVGERVRVHGITASTDGALSQLATGGEVTGIDPTWPRYTVRLDTGWQTVCRPCEMESLELQDSLF